MTKRFSRSSKTLLRNAIRHADTHNKYVEEGDMWANRNRELNYARELNNSKPMRRAHMDRESRTTAVVDDRRSTYWARQLEKTEAADPDRWGHGGYKEMYPDEFDSERSSDESDSRGRSSSKADQSKPSRKRRSSGTQPHERSERDGRKREKTVVTLYSSVHANKSDQRSSHKDLSSAENSKHRKEKTPRKRGVSESHSEQENMDSAKSSKDDGRSSKKSRSTSSHKHSKHKKHGRTSRQKKTSSRSQEEEDQKRRRTFKDSDSSSESD